jgi:GNAT superfamily N-acetyltransferase
MSSADRERATPPWDDDDLNVMILREEPPTGFDCGRPEQNAYLYESARRDTENLASVTHLFFIKGIFAGYITLTSDGLRLASSEKDKGLRYTELPAMKLGQLGVDLRFQGRGFGAFLIGYAVDVARQLSASLGVGCRYVTVDAQPDLVTWYERLGFDRNKLVQKERIAKAQQAGRNTDSLAVSMRFDLREPE